MDKRTPVCSPLPGERDRARTPISANTAARRACMRESPVHVRWAHPFESRDVGAAGP